jgi:hypothetical protein
LWTLTKETYVLALSRERLVFRFVSLSFTKELNKNTGIGLSQRIPPTELMPIIMLNLLAKWYYISRAPLKISSNTFGLAYKISF